MNGTKVTVAICLAAVFGTLLLCTVVYFTHRCIRWQCFNLKYWFCVFAKREDFGNERAPSVNSSIESRRREEREKEKERRRTERERERERERVERRMERLRRKVEEWEDSEEMYRSTSYMAPRLRGGEMELAERTGRVHGQPYPYVPAYLPVFVPLGEPYVPQYTHGTTLPLDFLPPPLDVSTRNGMNSFQPTYPSTRFQSYEGHALPPPSVRYDVEEVGGASSSQHSTCVESTPASKAPVRADFIEICDEYPAIVKEALEREEKLKRKDKKKEKEKEVDNTSSSSSVEEVPRAYIPTATTQRPAFHFPRYPHVRNRIDPERIPTSHPRQG